ncbi:response regulator transcription factor [Nannocystaceae bacterium ST9]
MAERILLIEDDVELGRQVVERLRKAGFDPTWWQEGRRIAADEAPRVELVILDLMLPGAYGLDILRDLRACSEVPVLVLSARHDTADKILALRLGADDYMTKPFWPDELVERVRARLRRPVLQRGDVIELGSLRLDLAIPEVRVDARVVELTRVELAFLTALAKRPGQALTRAWLVQQVLDPEREGSERTLDAHVSRLRKKLGREVVIETVWGIGYRLAGSSS